MLLASVANLVFEPLCGQEMLDDIKTRREIIDKVDSEAKKLLADCTAKMVDVR